MITYKVLRTANATDGILGYLYRGDDMVCFTLEPPVREKYGAIPGGDYALTWEKSPKLGIFTPRLLGVLNRRGVLIHAGNTVDDTEGCILVGSGYKISESQRCFLTRSRIARDKVYDLIQSDLADGGLANILVEE